MSEIVFALEERSAKEMLEGLIPRLGIEAPPIRYIVFDGKQDLERNLKRRIQGYLNPAARFIVIRDQDSHPDCRILKQNLAQICASAGRPESIIRIMCRELETIYLADLRAVAAALEITGIESRQNEAKFRSPDRLTSPSHELTRLTGGLYQKIQGSRLIGQHLDISNSRSSTFEALILGIRRVCSQS